MEGVDSGAFARSYGHHIQQAFYAEHGPSPQQTQASLPTPVWNKPEHTPSGHHRVCLFLELRKCRAPRRLSSRGSKPGGAIGVGGGGRSNPSRYWSWGLDKPKAEPHPGCSQVKWDSSRDASSRHLLKASLGPAAPSPGQARPASTCPSPFQGTHRSLQHGAMTPSPTYRPQAP